MGTADGSGISGMLLGALADGPQALSGQSHLSEKHMVSEASFAQNPSVFSGEMHITPQICISCRFKIVAADDCWSSPNLRNVVAAVSAAWRFV